MNGEGSALLYSIGDQEPRPVAGDSEMELAPGKTIAFDLESGGHWYGHGFNHDQPYPLEAGTISNDGFAVNNIQSSRDGIPVAAPDTGLASCAATERLTNASMIHMP